MSTWRRKALAAFPELRYEINSPRGEGGWRFSYYSLWFHLLPASRSALDASDEAALARIFDLAHWCFRQDRRAPDLCNAVGVSFYEHVFDVARIHWPDLARFIPPDVVRECWCLWESQLDAEGMEMLRRVFAAMKIEP